MSYSKDHQQWIKVLKADFEEKKRLWPGACQSHQNQIRQTQLEHFSHFLEKGFPLDKDPYWKFTNINSFLKSVFLPREVPLNTFEDTTNVKFFSFPQFPQIHFHNGVLRKSSLKNLPDGVQLCQWEDLTPDFPAWSWIRQSLKKKGDGFYHLAGALPSSGYVLFIGKVELPLHIHFSFDKSFQGNRSSACSSLWNLRNFIFLNEQADITFIESVSTSIPILVNSVTSVKNSQDSSLKWLHIDQGQSTSFYLNQVHCDMEQSSSMNRLGFSFGSGFSRDTVEVWHLGEKARSVLLGLSILKKKVLRDQRFYVHHAQKEGYSRQFSRGILNDKAKNIFHGKVHVAFKATQTDCAQSAKNLLLSSTADAYAQPEMEINCGEVKAQHGATTGPLSRDEIFYLQSRGLEYRAAVEFLVMAYITDVLNQFPDKKLVQHLTQDIWKNKHLYLNL
ncbi:MAG: SufD family Fe-S cluster assembly protein [Bdellovibrionales bacterium]|nr:SufD family Fe-S cluster assembly protein [Bdellovibrionales bacterium]